MVWMGCWITSEAKNNQPSTEQLRVNPWEALLLWEGSGSCGRDQVLVGGIRFLWEGSAKLVAIFSALCNPDKIAPHIPVLYRDIPFILNIIPQQAFLSSWGRLCFAFLI